MLSAIRAPVDVMAWGSSAIRITAAIMIGFVLASALIFAAIAWQTGNLLERRNAERVLTETRLLSEIAARDGRAALMAALRDRHARRGDMLYGLSDAAGNPDWLGGLKEWPAALDRDNASASFDFLPDDASAGARPRAAIGAALRLPDGSRLLVARDVTEQQALMRTFRAWVFGGLALMALAALIAGWMINRALMGRLARMSETAREIMAGDLSHRMPLTASNDEFDALAADLNAMLDRIERLMAGLREVSDNIAHDLKTPLNRLRIRAEEALRDPAGDAACRDGLERVLVEADDLMRTFNALLQVARLEAGTPADNAERFDISAMIGDVAEFYAPVVEEAGARLVVDIEPDVEIRANRQLISQALTNLLENAMKYGLEGAATKEIMVGVARAGRFADVWVADRGSGIRACDRERVLRRFVRLDSARTTPGTGIGLSLAAAVARGHGGEILLHDNAPGLKVIIRLPTDVDNRTVLSSEARPAGGPQDPCRVGAQAAFDNQPVTRNA